MPKVIFNTVSMSFMSLFSLLGIEDFQIFEIVFAHMNFYYLLQFPDARWMRVLKLIFNSVPDIFYSIKFRILAWSFKYCYIISI